MPSKVHTDERRERSGGVSAAHLMALAGLMLAAAMPARAGNPWERIATMIRTKAANAASTATVTTQPAEAMPGVGAVPDEVATTSGSQPRRLGSAALALMQMTTGTAVANLGKTLAGGKNGPDKVLELGRESDENEALLATNLFKKKEILRLLGDAPRFVYDPQNRPDPMLVPWVRRAAIFKELSAIAEEYFKNGELDKAVEVYQRILQMDDPRFNAEVHSKLQAIADKQNKQAIALMKETKAQDEKLELPAWIHDNTTGVIVSPDNAMCLVGEFMLRAGDKVPSYPEVTVVSISSQKVVYQIRNKTFDVPLNTN